jgi:hypothetical protein
MWDVLLTVLYGCEVWSPILGEEHNRLKIFDNRVPEKDIRHSRKKDEAHTEELRFLSLADYDWFIKYRSRRLAVKCL